jgi:hypothetical protein
MCITTIDPISIELKPRLMIYILALPHRDQNQPQENSSYSCRSPIFSVTAIPKCAREYAVIFTCSVYALLGDITLPSSSYRVAMTNEFVTVCDSKFTLI